MALVRLPLWHSAMAVSYTHLDLRAVRGEHQAEVEAALEGASLGVHGLDGGQAYGVQHGPQACQRPRHRPCLLYTSSCTAEGLDLGGVVVGLVLEQEQPVLILTVHIALDH